MKVSTWYWLTLSHFKWQGSSLRGTSLPYQGWIFCHYCIFCPCQFNIINYSLTICSFFQQQHGLAVVKKLLASADINAPVIPKKLLGNTKFTNIEEEVVGVIHSLACRICKPLVTALRMLLKILKKKFSNGTRSGSQVKKHSTTMSLFSTRL